MSRSDEATKSIPPRNGAVDAFRGACVASMFFVGYPQNKKVLHPFFRHAEWSTITFADCIYPAFLFIVGYSLALSAGKEIREGASEERASEWRLALSRILRLFFLGVFLRSVSASKVVIGLGTLQCIALAFLLAFPFRRSSVRTVGMGVAALFCLYLLSVEWVRAPGAGWEDRWIEGHTFPEWVDTLILGRPRGPEGVVTTVMAGCSVLLGLVAARLASNWRNLIGFSTLLFGAALASGSLLSVPLSLQLYTPTCVLFTGGLSVIALVVLQKLFQVSEGGQGILSSGLFALQVYGRNAIAVYAALKLFHKWIFLTWTVSDPPVTLSRWYQGALLSAVSPAAASYLYGGSMVLLGWLFCLVLWRKGIFVKI